jgi:outer membrane protein OmpA-like peptidoglycan-associated protein
MAGVMPYARAFLISLILVLVAAVPAQASGPFPVTETFRGTSMGPGWVTSGTAALTGPAGDGWMRLTPAVNSSSGSVRLTDSFPSDRGVLAEFDFAIWGGTQADGLAFFLYDGAQNEGAFQLGQLGGSLGYSSCGAQPGLSGAYIGVAFDVYGNFANTSFCGQTGIGPNLNKNRVVVRGGQSQGYAYLGSAVAAQPLRTSRSQPLHARVAVVDDKLSVYITFANGQIQEVLSDFALPAPPQNLKLGWVAGTGGQNDNHEVRDGSVLLPVDLATTVTDGVTGANRAGTLSWTATVTNDGPNPVDDAEVEASALTSGLTDVEWTCTGSCPAASGTGMPDTTVDLADGASATFQISAQAGSATDNATLRVAATPTGATGEYKPTNNTATDTTDLSPVNDVQPAFALTPGGTAAVSSLGTWRGGNLTLAREWQRCAPDGTACVDIPGATAGLYVTTTDDEGKTVRLKVTATNSAGTATAHSTHFVLPDTTIAGGPPALSASASATVNVVADRVDATLECRLDGAAYAPCADPVALTGLADGEHTLDVRAVYGGLHDASPASITWRVDTTAPETTFSGPSGVVRRTTATFDLSGGDSYECRLDGGAFAPCPDPVTFTGLADGVHTLEVRARDAAGNVGRSVVHRWTIDTSEPTLTAEIIGGTPSARAEVTVHGREIGVGCRLDGAPLADCTVRAYADVRGGARASALRLIGTGRVAAGGAKSAEVEIGLNALGRRLLRQNPQGLRARLMVDATPVGADEPLTARLRATLVASRRTVSSPRPQFEIRSARLLPSTRRWLDRVAPRLAGSRSVRCTGHTSGLGDDLANEELGLARAKAVCRYLRAHGVKAKMKAVSRGETRPRASNRTADGRARNRRVELTVRR